MEASTITELLVTMTVTGILMLAVYDGLGLIAGTINRHLKKNAARDAMYSHYIVESIIEKADSCILDGNMMIFHTAGCASDTMVVFVDRIEYRTYGHKDTLFTGCTGCNITESTEEDRLLTVFITDELKDTIALHYDFHTH